MFTSGELRECTTQAVAGKYGAFVSVRRERLFELGPCLIDRTLEAGVDSAAVGLGAKEPQVVDEAGEARGAAKSDDHFVTTREHERVGVRSRVRHVLALESEILRPAFDDLWIAINHRGKLCRKMTVGRAVSRLRKIDTRRRRQRPSRAEGCQV